MIRVCAISGLTIIPSPPDALVCGECLVSVIALTQQLLFGWGTATENTANATVASFETCQETAMCQCAQYGPDG